MTPYAQQRGIFSAKDIELLSRIKTAFNNLPDLDLGQDDTGQKILISCHMLARAFARHFGLEYRDGYYVGWEHSWLVTPLDHIIDIYPVGAVGGPIMIANDFVGSRKIFKPCHARRLTPKFSDPLFRRAVRILVKAIRSHPA